MVVSILYTQSICCARIFSIFLYFRSPSENKRSLHRPADGKKQNFCQYFGKQSADPETSDKVFEDKRVAGQNGSRQQEVGEGGAEDPAAAPEYELPVERIVHARADDPGGDIGQAKAAGRQDQGAVHRVVHEKAGQGGGRKIGQRGSAQGECFYLCHDR